MISVAFFDLPISQIDNRVKAAYVAAIRRALPGALAGLGQTHLPFKTPGFLRARAVISRASCMRQHRSALAPCMGLHSHNASDLPVPAGYNVAYTTHIDDGDWRGADGEEGEPLLDWASLGRPGQAGQGREGESRS